MDWPSFFIGVGRTLVFQILAFVFTLERICRR